MSSDEMTPWYPPAEGVSGYKPEVGDYIFEFQMDELEKRKRRGESISMVDRMRPYVDYQQRLWMKMEQLLLKEAKEAKENDKS